MKLDRPGIYLLNFIQLSFIGKCAKDVEIMLQPHDML
jgi:hypothetical protein